MGFPTADEFSEALGVSPEDRERWKQRREAAIGDPGTARMVADQTAKQGLELLQMGVQASMYGHEAGEADRQNRRAEEKVTVSRTRTRFTDEPEFDSSSDDEYDGMGF